MGARGIKIFSFLFSSNINTDCDYLPRSYKCSYRIDNERTKIVLYSSFVEYKVSVAGSNLIQLTSDVRVRTLSK